MRTMILVAVVTAAFWWHATGFETEAPQSSCSGLPAGTACQEEEDADSAYLQLRPTQGTATAALGKVARAMSSAAASIAPPQQVWVLAGGWGGLCVLGFIQRLRYMDVAASDEETSEHLKVLARADANIALAHEQDAARKSVLVDNWNLAFRAAVFIMLSASPALMKDVKDWFHFMTYDTTYTAVLIMWTMDRTIGKTTAAVWDAILGTLLSFLFMFFISGFFPGGVHEGDNDMGFSTHHVWMIGMAYFLLTVLGMLFLNFPNGVRVWCLSYHMANMMYFLKPKPVGSPAIFSEGFHVNVQGQMFGYCLITVFACGLSIIALSLPTPKSSHRAALTKADVTKREFCTLLRSLVRIYLGDFAVDTSNVFIRVQMYRSRLAQNLSEMASDVSFSWWEHFDRGSYAAVRHMLGQHVGTSRKLVAGVEALESGLAGSFATDSETRVKLIEEIKEPLLALESSMLKLFEEVTDGTKDGVVDEAEAESMLQLVSTVEADMLSFSSKFRSACVRLSGESFVSRHNAFKDEYSVVFVICSMAREITVLANDLAKREPAQRAGAWKVFKEGVSNFFVGTMEASHQSFAQRNSISLLLCFFFGYVGNGSLIPAYTADIATNASLLLSNFVGSALQKNMGRVQGLVIGSVVGRVIHALLSMSDCDGSVFGVSMVITLGVFSSVSFYLFMSSETFGFTAYLFGGFGSMVILSDCAASENTEGAYLAIVSATLCIIIMAGVDLVLAPSAADDAADAFFNFMRDQRDCMASLLEKAKMPEDHNAREMGCTLEDTSRSAEEASKAPSMVKKPFRLELFTALVSTGRQSMVSFEILHRAMISQPDSRMTETTPSKYAGGVSPVLEVFKACKSYQGLSKAMGDMLLNCFLLVESTVQAETSIEAIHSSKDISMNSMHAAELLEQLVQEISGETEGKFKETLIPIDQCPETALQVAVNEMSMIIKRCQDMKRHSMTHV